MKNSNEVGNFWIKVQQKTEIKTANLSTLHMNSIIKNSAMLHEISNYTLRAMAQWFATFWTIYSQLQ